MDSNASPKYCLLGSGEGSFFKMSKCIRGFNPYDLVAYKRLESRACQPPSSQGFAPPVTLRIS